jgi:cyanoexosortase A
MLEQLALNQKKEFIFLALGVALSAIYFALIWKADDTGQLGMSVLFYVCVATLLYEKRKELIFKFDGLSFLVGLLLIGWILLNSSPETDDYTVRLFPFVSGLAIGLMAANWQMLSQYRKEILLLFFLGVPSFLAYYFIDITVLTAKASSLLLWYSGFDVVTQGNVLSLVDGTPVQVIYDCSGIDMINYMLGLSVICLIMFPIGGIKRFFFPVVAMVLGFVVNCCRVALLAILVSTNRLGFNDWHTGTGSYTFALIGVVILGAIYWLLMNFESASASPDESGGTEV